MKANRDNRGSRWSRDRAALKWLIPCLCGWVLLQQADCGRAAQHQFSQLPLFDTPSNQVIAEPTPVTSPSAPVSPRTAAGSTNAPAQATTNSMDALNETHELAIGDRLSFRIVEDEDESKQILVTDSGDIEVPYIGRFPAEGRTCKELARALKAELEKDYYYQATVILAVDLMAKSRGKVYLVGPVHVPGPQEIPSDETFTLSKAILRAGGFNDFADRKNVRVTRKGTGGSADGQVFVVNVAEVLDKGKTEGDLTLQPGDLIFIPERLIRF